MNDIIVKNKIATDLPSGQPNGIDAEDLRGVLDTMVDYTTEILDTVENLDNIGILNASTGVATIEGGTVTLTATPPTGWLSGQQVEVQVVGNIGFGGVNFTSGTLLNIGDKLRKRAAQWELIKFAVGDGTITANKLNDSFVGIVSDYVNQSITITPNSFIKYDGTVISLTNWSYSEINVTEGEKYKITTIVDGSDARLAIFKNAGGSVIATLVAGINGTPLTFTDYLLTVPTGATKMFIDGKVATPIVAKKRILIEKAVDKITFDALATRVTNEETVTQTYKTILSDFETETLTIVPNNYVKWDGTVIPLTGWSYTTLTVIAGDKFKISTVLNGTDSRLAIFKNSAGTVISSLVAGTNSVDTPYVDYDVTVPANAVTMIIDGKVASPIVAKKSTLITQAGKKTEIESLKTRVTAEETATGNYKDILSDYTTQSITIVANSFIKWDGTTVSLTGWSYTQIAVTAGEKFKVTSLLSGSDTRLVIFKNSGGSVVSTLVNGVNGVETLYTDYAFTVPATATQMFIDGKVSVPIIVKKSVLIDQAGRKADIVAVQEAIKSFWFGKKILWIGDSIAQGAVGGGYPQLVGTLLGANVTNVALGSSMARRGRVTTSVGDPIGLTGISYQNITRALSQSLADKEDIIANWDTYKLLMTGSPPSTLTDSDKNFFRSTSYEYKINDYIGTPTKRQDLYVFAHGHNDNLYTDSDSEFTNVPVDTRNKNTYIGAMNFLFDLILKDNPRARIMLVGHYEDARKTRISVAQEALAKYRGFPLLKTWEKLGWTQQVIETTGYWSDAYTWNTSGGSPQNLTQTQVWMQDDLHPYSDPAKTFFANVVAQFLNSQR